MCNNNCHLKKQKNKNPFGSTTASSTNYKEQWGPLVDFMD